ncbi:MAG TPA: helix-turn-helix domain-containing protein [Nitrososphaerales archaeon]|nr:helix-turn-helix domain-containing protein [Nitrososphaerales archaeon]
MALVTEAKLRVIRDLIGGPKGFNALMRATGINSKTLSSNLKFLEQRGVVTRQVVTTKPYSVQYSLTASGKELGPVLEEFGRWGAKWLPESR